MPDEIIPDTSAISAASAAARIVRRWRSGEGWSERNDSLVVEEPLEVRVDGRRWTVTMRTPGDDFDLVRGLLLTEGLIRENADIADLRYCPDAEEEAADRAAANAIGSEVTNVLGVRLSRSAPPHDARRWQRALLSGSSCGLCGQAALDAVLQSAPPLPPSAAPPLSAEVLLRLPPLLREKQATFWTTGGLHAAGLFTLDGTLLAAYEDIGRHNATDKVIGHALREGWLSETVPPLILLVSGRASFEIVQKALMARLPIIAAVSAASALAADLAASANQTLIGFLRDASLTVYSGGVS